MAKCSKCGKESMGLKLNDKGLCQECANKETANNFYYMYGLALNNEVGDTSVKNEDNAAEYLSAIVGCHEELEFRDGRENAISVDIIMIYKRKRRKNSSSGGTKKREKPIQTTSKPRLVG
jgi:hypothetical protein